MQDQGDLISRFLMGMTKVTIWVIGISIQYLLSPPDPSISLLYGLWGLGSSVSGLSVVKYARSKV